MMVEALRTRRLEAELLDELPAADPRARRSRRDLRRINGLMLQANIMVRLLAGHGGPTPPRSLVDLGGGDGGFLLRLARSLAPHWSGVHVTLIDRVDIVAPETRRAMDVLGWRLEVVAADVFDALTGVGRVDAVIANLFLHHFARPELQRLLAGIAAAAPFFVACEPRRSAVALGATRLLPAIGCNDVTRHDAMASVRAGFARKELSALWPMPGWTLDERYAPPFTHTFVACDGEPSP
jgi:hypothetical protein